MSDPVKPRGETQANQSVAKAVRILDYFRERPEGGLSDLAEYAGLGPSTALRLALSLERCGALVRERGTRTYSVGPWLLELAAATARYHPYSTYVHQVLVELRDETGETASYWLIDGAERLCIDRLNSHHALSSTVEIGVRASLHVGAAGRVLLAFSPDDRRESVLETLRSKAVDVEALTTSLEKIRADGYAVSSEERAPGLASVAVPVFNRNALAGAVSLSAPVSRATPSEQRTAVKLLSPAADRLSNYRLLAD